MEGLSRFLVEHETCDAGFDVSHPDGVGNGLISMTCRGCGKSYEYALATEEIEREIEFEPVPVAKAAAPLPPPPPPPTKKRPKPKTANRGRDRIIVGTLLVLALAAIAIAVIRVMNEREDSSVSEPPTPATTAAPEPEPQPQAAGPQGSQPQEPAQQAQPAQPARQKQQRGQDQPADQQKQQSSAPQAREPAGGLETDEKLMRMVRYSLMVPDPWTQSQYEGGTLIGPPANSAVSVQVFFEDNSAADIGTLERQSVEFAQAQVGGKQVGRTRRTTVDGDPAFELTVRGRGGTRAVLGLLSGSTSYLVLGNIGRSASPEQAADVRRALRTFRPEPA